jgi:alkylated DNA repair dioxygenase AlkB
MSKTTALHDESSSSSPPVAANPTLPSAIEHPSTNPCTTPDELCPRNEAGEKVRIHGLSYYKNFFSKEEQAELLTSIYEQPFQKIIARRQQFYGEVYYHTSHKNRLLQPSKADDGSKNAENDDNNDERSPISLPMETLLSHVQERCQPFFNEADGFPSQLLVNEYRNNLGIASHFEDMTAFGSVILTISLRNPIYMTLKKPMLRTNGCEDYHDIQKILLEPGSLLVMQGDARYDYRHGIAKYKWITGLNKNIENDNGENSNDSAEYEHTTTEDGIMCRDEPYRRVSVTIRHLLHTRRKVVETECEGEERKYEFDTAINTSNDEDGTRTLPKRYFPKKVISDEAKPYT